MAIAQLSGEITSKDVATFHRIERDLDTHCRRSFPRIEISLDSDGGDVRSAIAIGRLARKWFSVTAVLGNNHCYSACVLTLAGGVRRIAVGEIGIHRPYTMTALPSQTLQEAQSNYKRISNNVQRYLSEMNMPPMLFETMMAVDSTTIRVLSGSETQAFGLNGSDAAIEDYFETKAARAMGLSKPDYLSRLARIRQTCQSLPLSEQTTCVEGIMSGQRQ